MWKKDDLSGPGPGPDPVPTPRSGTDERTSTPEARATIGRSISIHGEVTGDEDLLIQGRVDGSVKLEQHAVTVGPDGEVTASITARVITVKGRVDGNLKADEQVALFGSARVQGDITAPRVVLEDGAHFRGGVDMGGAVRQDPVRQDNGRSAPGSSPGSGSRLDNTSAIHSKTPSNDRVSDDATASQKEKKDTADETVKKK